MKKSTKIVTNVLIASGVVLTGMHIYNRFVAKKAIENNRLKDDHGEYYDWKFGQIFYQKKGSGSPILLIHDTDATASSVEWSKITNKLAMKHTVYSIDLLGCGRSDKPGLDYNNYLYVSLVTSFVHEIIGKKTDVIASNLSSSFVLAAYAIDKNLFDHIICINPTTVDELSLTPTVRTKIKKFLLNTPIVGTFMYNVLSNPIHIERIFMDQYYYKPQLASNELKETYYEAAHLKDSRGKFLLSSIFGNYMHLNIKHIVKSIDKPVCIIGSREIKGNRKNLEAFTKLNKHFDLTMLSGAKNYPQLEIPDKTLKVINDFLIEEL